MASQTNFNYGFEAETFVDIMRNLAPELVLDFSLQSVDSLERFVATHFDPPGSRFVGEGLLLGLSSYMGEVIIRNIGGHWSDRSNFEVNRIGAIERIFPLQKVHKRFKHGAEDSLAWYIQVILRHSS